MSEEHEHNSLCPGCVAFCSGLYAEVHRLAEAERKLKKATRGLSDIKRHMELAVDPPHMSAVWNIATNALKEIA
jgi:hypothetical protein